MRNGAVDAIVRSELCRYKEIFETPSRILTKNPSVQKRERILYQCFCQDLLSGKNRRQRGGVCGWKKMQLSRHVASTVPFAKRLHHRPKKRWRSLNILILGLHDVIRLSLGLWSKQFVATVLLLCEVFFWARCLITFFQRLHYISILKMPRKWASTQWVQYDELNHKRAPVSWNS